MSSITRILADRLTAPKSAGRRRGLDRVFLRDLILTCSIGVHAHEHEAPQRVKIDLSMWVRQNPAAIDDDIANVVSYEDVVSGIERLLGDGHIELVETAAERIADLCLEDRRCAKVRVKVEKLDVYTHAAGVGVEIERSRDAGAPPGTLPFPPTQG